MDVQIIPCLKDNYAYLVKNILIDAPDFKTIDNFLTQKKMNLNFILSTHHHGDHVDGNVDLKRKYNCHIYGYADDHHPIPGVDTKLKPNEFLNIDGINIQALSVPGHTSHHVIYYFKDQNLLFSGDTLFSMGCGRLFEGTYIEMFESLQKIKSLPPQTEFYCGHEYSQKNAQFALSVDPDNLTLKEHFQKVSSLRKQGLATVPTTLELEKKINPFLRASNVDEFAKLRQLRDSF
jgi:hydroxyacylglutathione hydrolase